MGQLYRRACDFRTRSDAATIRRCLAGAAPEMLLGELDGLRASSACELLDGLRLLDGLELVDGLALLDGLRGSRGLRRAFGGFGGFRRLVRLRQLPSFAEAAYAISSCSVASAIGSAIQFSSSRFSAWFGARRPRGARGFQHPWIQSNQPVAWLHARYLPSA